MAELGLPGEEAQQFKTEAYQQQIEMEGLRHQAELLLQKVTEESDKHTAQDLVSELKLMWESLEEKVINRQRKLEGALLALGQFQRALDELLMWLTHTEDLLNEQKPLGGDPRAIEIELAKHHLSGRSAKIRFNLCGFTSAATTQKILQAPRGPSPAMVKEYKQKIPPDAIRSGKAFPSTRHVSVSSPGANGNPESTGKPSSQQMAASLASGLGKKKKTEGCFGQT